MIQTAFSDGYGGAASPPFAPEERSANRLPCAKMRLNFGDSVSKHADGAHPDEGICAVRPIISCFARF